MRPLAIRGAALSASWSNWSRSSWSTWLGSIRAIASSFADHALVDHVGGDADGRGGGPLGGAGLEHVQAATLDRELQVLDVAVVLLELLADGHEVVVDLRPELAHLGDLDGRPDAGHDVLALRVGQELALQLLATVDRVAGEGDARARVIAHVAVDHRHHVDGRAQVVGDVLVLAVVAGALAEPRGEHGLDGQIELLLAGPPGRPGRSARG